ncbi:mannose-1-phosphate guanylyltransferase/mannose-6-phosphate isomerase [Formosimonas limnophila]|uniref:mannose-1-phosphate guanylyltransferase n=1 Tax=Formosimonas limnophila TaxID=1384487 RepID=A0A8J3FYK1_9BURK|nr:mannose-1-phosphate guanylyltransferase/mannose-6-phosphate isomerase [Formosimonas limnophila]GHA73818.1 mannose-1-phosphate guanylyltransferase/mannose-6-phosphate isomerase [Formosimonas limnophila]
MNQNAQQLVPVILSGGSGTRLWPLSREKHPKQLLSLIDDETLLQLTALRLDGLTLDIAVSDRPIVVCNQEYRFITAEQLLQVGVVAERIILEPFGKNTAPALTLAAQTICANGSDAVLLAMAADHAMRNIDAFHAAIANGLPAALDGHVVTFGVTPNAPVTGYGYIQANDREQYPNVLDISQFVEKPDVSTAQAYLDSGDYLWNSGIFMVKASSWLQAMARYAPDILLACDAAVTNAAVDLDFVRVDETAFGACPSDSIDYAVMEKLSLTPDSSIKGYVVPMDAGWSDVGAWDTVWQVLDKDQNGNVAQGDALFVKTTNSLVLSHERVVSCLGLDDIVIVDTVDALLVAKKSEVRDLKSVVAAIKKTHVHLTENHRKVFRPWGAYDSIAADERFQVKRIIVKPGASLSLQMHHHRAEHWIVVRGTGRVTRGDEVFLLSENESAFIPLGVVHRLENPGKTTLELIEVQSGSYLGEDDIVRLEDVYGRDGSIG